MKRFTCPKCDCNVAEEVLTGVTTSFAFTGVNEDGELEHTDDTENYGGEFSRYQCSCCGFVIVDENGDTVSSPEELAEWIEKQDSAK